MDALTAFQSIEIHDEISKLESLISQANVNFLIGAGCSRNAGLPLIHDLTKEVVSKQFCQQTNALLKHVVDGFKGDSQATIEDYLSELVDLLAISDRRMIRKATNPSIEIKTGKFTASDVRMALGEIKCQIVELIEGKPVDISTHQKFVRAIHRSVRPGKRQFKEANYFILNYDTLFEDALAFERIPYTDGFQGGPSGWWDPMIFENSETPAKIFKLHGSIDWCRLKDVEVPMRKRGGVQLSGIEPEERTLIYPASTKYVETQRDPHAQLLSFMRKILRENKDSILLVSGYSFADTHINLEIEKAIFENDQLTIAAFTSNDEPVDTLKDWLKLPTIGKQIRVYTGKGFFHGETEYRSGTDLPWWKFEVLTRLLSGER